MRKQKVPLLYAYSNYVLPKPSSWSNEIQVTGYWFLEPEKDWKPPTDLVDFLNGGSPPVYIGFGSMSDRDPEYITKEYITKIVLAALEKTKQRGIISKGWGGISNTDLGDRLFTINSVPHDWLFPKCAAIVHHGGAGTTAASLKAGVPSIIVPFFSDQPFWGNRVADLGVGTKPIAQKELTVDKLSAAIDTVINDNKMRDRSAHLGKQICAENGVKNAVTAIDRY